MQISNVELYIYSIWFERIGRMEFDFYIWRGRKIVINEKNSDAIIITV